MAILVDQQQYVLATLAANGTISIPAGYSIRRVYFKNNTANAVTGGIRIGTTDGGAQVIVAQAIGANAFLASALADVLLVVFSATAPTTLFVQAVVAWNSASVDIVVALDRAVP